MPRFNLIDLTVLLVFASSVAAWLTTLPGEYPGYNDLVITFVTPEIPIEYRSNNRPSPYEQHVYSTSLARGLDYQTGEQLFLEEFKGSWSDCLGTFLLGGNWRDNINDYGGSVDDLPSDRWSTVHRSFARQVGYEVAKRRLQTILGAGSESALRRRLSANPWYRKYVGAPLAMLLATLTCFFLTVKVALALKRRIIMR